MTVPGVLGHHASLAIGNSNIVQDIGDVRAGLGEPHILLAAWLARLVDEGIVLIRTQETIAATGRAQHENSIVAGRHALPADNHTVHGRTTARDLGLGKLVSAKKDCVGRVLSERSALVASDRPIFVGLKAVDPAQSLSAGAHLLAPGAPASAEHDDGHVTSVAPSPTLRCDIGLGFLKRGRERIGERIRAVDLLRDHDVLCEVVDPVFIDAKGERLRG